LLCVARRRGKNYAQAIKSARCEWFRTEYTQGLTSIAACTFIAARHYLIMKSEIDAPTILRVVAGGVLRQAITFLHGLQFFNSGNRAEFARAVASATRFGLTTEDLMDEFHVSRGTISRWITGKSTPPSYTREVIVGRICKLLAQHYRVEDANLPQLVFSAAQVRAALTAMAATFAKQFEQKQFVLIPVLQGGVFVFTRIASQLYDADLQFEYQMVNVIRTASPGEFRSPVIDTRFLQSIHQLANKHVVFLDDICDRGETFFALSNAVTTANPASVTCAALINRKAAKLRQPDIVGIETDSPYWLYGSGMDLNGSNREIGSVLGIKDPTIRYTKCDALWEDLVSGFVLPEDIVPINLRTLNQQPEDLTSARPSIN
jgi:hypoxanthine-guanine phosphoribosyltransferase